MRHVIKKILSYSIMNFREENKGPDFIGIGMERSGTSWLFTQLAFHPDIWVPPLKELHFFDVIDPKAKYLTHRYSYHLKSRIKQKFAPFMDMKHRPEFRKNPYWMGFLWDSCYFSGAFDIRWYKRLFHSRFTGDKVSGEITPAYSNLTPDTIQIILDMNPDIKFLLMVRNPMQRLWSGVIHHFLHVKKKKFEDVSEEEILDFLENSAAQNRSDLKSILETWKSCIDPKNLLIQSFEDITDNPENLIKNTYSFLDVDSDFLPLEEMYKKKINSYTREDYLMPNKIRLTIERMCQPSLEALIKTHPEIVQKWLKSYDFPAMQTTS